MNQSVDMSNKNLNSQRQVLYKKNGNFVAFSLQHLSLPQVSDIVSTNFFPTSVKKLLPQIATSCAIWPPRIKQTLIVSLGNSFPFGQFGLVDNEDEHEFVPFMVCYYADQRTKLTPSMSKWRGRKERRKSLRDAKPPIRGDAKSKSITFFYFNFHHFSISTSQIFVI